MNVASLELSKWLYELSGWHNTEYHYWKKDGKWQEPKFTGCLMNENIPAYDLGFLLRKLPPVIEEVNGFNAGLSLGVLNNVDSLTWAVGYKHVVDNQYFILEDTPENAAAKLCIILFEQGDLEKEES